MRNNLKEWCETSDIDLSEIERRAIHEFENNRYPTLVYISADLLAELTKAMGARTTYSPGQAVGGASSIVSIMTSVGSLNVTPVKRLRNFLMVGRKEDFDALVNSGIDPVFWNDQERVRIDQLFEDEVIGVE